MKPALPDPTYNQEDLKFNGVWHIAFIISEMVNDNAPIGWSKYIPLAEEAIKKAREEA